MLELPDSWVWDSWVLDDGRAYHLFFLRASRALHDPDRRHHRASIGHATSDDLRTWSVRPDALVHADQPAWDDLATWTGSSVLDDDGRCWLFYTGLSHAEGGRVQRIGAAVSDDLVSWTRVGNRPLLVSDARWYETDEQREWVDVTWRDPFVVRDPGGDGWHMLLTARAATGASGGRGVIGHARSSDLLRWEVLPPMSEPVGFAWLEVPQVHVIDGRPVLVFSCWSDRAATGSPSLGGSRGDDEPGAPGGVWTVPGASLLGPWRFDQATPLNVPSFYAGHLVRERDGTWSAMGFRDGEGDRFSGSIGDPIPVRHNGDRLVVTSEP